MIRKMLSRSALLAAALLLVSCGGSDADPDDPRGRSAASGIAVLVDLSQTWHNPPATEEMNGRILRRVGDAIVRGAPTMPMPIAIRYHAIGEASLGRTPLCVAVYRPTTFKLGRRRAEEVVTDRATFERYLTEECPMMFLARPAERSTEIGAAIVSAYRASALLREGAKRTFVILSDFKEETPAQVSFDGIDFSRARFLLVYRTLDEDRVQPVLQQARLRAWESLLRSLGAEVIPIDENAVLGSPQEFQILLGA